MKRKYISRMVLGFLLLGLLALGAWRYYTLNQDYLTKPLVTVIPFKVNEQVKTDTVSFSVTSVKTSMEKHTFSADLTLHLKLARANNYGFKENSLYFYENMGLEVPYQETMPAMHITQADGSTLKLSEQSLNKELPLTIHFSRDQNIINYGNRPIYFTFLIPKDHHFNKYRLLLN